MSTLSETIVPTFSYDAYAHRGRNIIQAFHKKLKRVGGPTLPAAPAFGGGTSQDSKDPIGILGAGPAGLYTALILDDLGIPYVILESQNRVGGRLFTFKFEDPMGEPYNYYDIGAMRYPKIGSMNRVFSLFEYEKLNEDGIALKSKLTPFYFTAYPDNNAFYSYNGVTVRQNEVPGPGEDPFKAKEVILDVANPDPYIMVGTQDIVDDVIDPFVARLLDDLEYNSNEGWKYLQSYDMHSTRSYMATVYIPSEDLVSRGVPATHLPTDVINWLETFDKSSGWYDRSLAETVLEAIAFGHVPKGRNYDGHVTEWFCLNGGSIEIAMAMKTYIEKRQPGAVVLNSRVTAISLSEDKGSMEVLVRTADEVKPYRFSHVISTIPLPVLHTLDLSGSKLTPMQTNALRQLNYGPSIKIGLQFKTAWWTTASDKDGRPLKIIGGQTYTDKILRTVVYPSFGDAKEGKTTTLIGSYCWTEDAERLAALIEREPTELVKLTLRELADIHNVTVDFLQDQLIASKAYSWTNDVNAMGAFAFFGPGKFENVYQSLTAPAADGRLHFAGEAISVRHAWVEGALDSAWRAVYEMLILHPQYRRLHQTFLHNWGQNPEWVTSPEGPRNRKGGIPDNLPRVPEPEEDLVLQQLRHVRPEYFDL